jgi:hypothetical protein
MSTWDNQIPIQYELLPFMRHMLLMYGSYNISANQRVDQHDNLISGTLTQELCNTYYDESNRGAD